MRILALNGSHRGRRGLTQALLERMKAGADRVGSSFEIVVLAECRIEPCLGCEACQAEGQRPLPCVLDGRDEVRGIFSAMRSADLLVFATPIYIFGMSSLLKSLLERINATADTRRVRVSKAGLVFHDVDASLCSKPFAFLGSCGNIEAETPLNAIGYFKSYSRFMDAPFAGVLVRPDAFLLEKEGKCDPGARAAIFRAFEKAGEELAVQGRIGRRTCGAACRSLAPMPLPVRLLMAIRPLRPVLIEAARRKGIVA
jgi:NAD(P)H-dependent FMN reductase